MLPGSSHSTPIGQRQRNLGTDRVDVPSVTKFHIDDYKLARTLGTGIELNTIPIQSQ